MSKKEWDTRQGIFYNNDYEEGKEISRDRGHFLNCKPSLGNMRVCGVWEREAY